MDIEALLREILIELRLIRQLLDARPEETSGDRGKLLLKRHQPTGRIVKQSFSRARS